MTKCKKCKCELLVPSWKLCPKCTHPVSKDRYCEVCGQYIEGCKKLCGSIKERTGCAWNVYVGINNKK